ncbi:MAG: addiction module protein [Planctomycetaceae bacterium]
MSTVTEILDHALQLEPADRGLIAHRLIASLDAESAENNQPEIDEAWETEILRRSEDLRSGRVQGIDGRESVARIRAALDARKKS